MIESLKRHPNARIPFPQLCNIYECEIGDSFVGPFVEIQRGVVIGDLCKIESHTFICTGVTIGDRVFVGHSVTFCNDLFPAIVGNVGPTRYQATTIEDDVIIGSGSTLLPVKIEWGAVIGAGSVVTKDVPSFAVVAGNPAKIIRQFDNRYERDKYFAHAERDHLLAFSRCSGYIS